MNAGKYVAMWVDRGRRHGEGGGESENEFNWPLPSFSLPPETHPLFAPSLNLQAQRLPQVLNKTPLVYPFPGLPSSSVRLRQASSIPPPLPSLGAPFPRCTSAPPSPLLASSTFPVWHSPRCAQVAGSAACCQVPTAVT